MAIASMALDFDIGIPLPPTKRRVWAMQTVIFLTGIAAMQASPLSSTQMPTGHVF